MFAISVCILENKTSGRNWHAEAGTMQSVGSDLTLECDKDYWLQNSTAGNPVTKQNITCNTSGDWSEAAMCHKISKLNSILLNLFFETPQPEICCMLYSHNNDLASFE
jgi:hypothetical protein